MAEEFLVKIGTELDTASINNLKQQISGIKTNPIKVEIDTSNVTYQINKIKNQIQNLSGIKINLTGNSAGKNQSNSVDAYTNSLQKSYRNLYNLSKQISSMELKIGKLNMSGINKNEISGYISELNKLKQTYTNLISQLNNGNNINFSSLFSSIDNAKTKISELSAKVDDSKIKLASDIKLKINNGTLSNQLSVIETKFKKLGLESNEVSLQIQKLKSLLGNMDASDDIESVIGDYQNFQQVLKTTENHVNVLQRTQTEQIGIVNKTTSAFGNLTKQVAAYFSAYQMINYSIRAMKDMCQNVLDVDTAMTELYRVTNLTEQQYDVLYDKMTASAKKYGSSLSEIINSTASWVRLGFDADTSNQLAEITSMYQHVTDLDEDTAVKNLVTAYKGYQDQLLKLTNGDEAAATEYIADIFDKLGNEFAVSAADVGESIKQCASTMNLAGNTIQESAAMAVGITENTQMPSKAGNALKILSLRLRGMKGDLEDLGEEVDENVESISKMQTQVLNMTHGKVNIFNDDGSFKSTYEIMKGIASIYDDLSDLNQADLLETIAGKNRANDVASLIQNWSQVEKAMEAATNASGTASEEQEKWMNSMEGHLQVFKATWQMLANDVIESDFLKGMTDSGMAFLDTLDNIINNFGTFPTLMTTIAAAMSFKNVGFFRTIEDEATLSGKRITSVFGNAFSSIKTIFSKSTQNILGSDFTARLQSDIKAIENYRDVTKNGMGSEKAATKYMSNASGVAVEWAKSEKSIKDFAKSTTEAEVALVAQNKSMKSAKSLIVEYNLKGKQTGLTQAEIARTVSVTNSSLGKYLTGLNGAKGSLGGYIVQLGAAKVATLTMRAATMALNMAFTMGISMAVSAAVSAISDYIHKEEEAREKALEAGEAAREESKQISELYDTYEDVSKAHKNGEASYGDIYKAAYDLCDVLGIERSELQGLVEEYGNLDAAMREVSTRALEDNIVELLGGYDAAKENLVKAANDVGWWQSSNELHYKNDKDFEKIQDALINSRFTNLDDFVYGLFGGSFMKLDPVENEKDAIKQYEKLVEMREYLTELAQSGELGINLDDLSGMAFFKELGKRIDDSKEAVEKYNETVEGVIENLANIEFNKFVSENGIPETRADFEKLKESIIETVKEQGDFTENQEDLKTSVDEFLRSEPELEKFFYTYNDGLVSICNGVDAVIDDINTLLKSSTSAYDSVSAINKLLNEQTTGVAIPINEDSMGTLLAYGDAIEYVNGIMQLNSEKARAIADAKVEEQIATNNANKEARQAQYLENSRQIEEYTDKLFKLTDLRSEEAAKIRGNIDALTEENNKYLYECTQLDVLNSSLRESISLYSDWKNAQSAAESGDMFDDTNKAFKEINDALNDNTSDNFGKVGREHYKASVDLIVPNSIDKDDEAAINSYINSIEKYFTFDETKKTELEKQLGDLEYKASIGEEVDYAQIDKIYADLKTYEKQKLSNISGLNTNAFCEEAVKRGLMVFDAATNEYNLAGETLMKDFANGMGLSMPMVQAMFGELEEYGVEFDWADEIPKTFGDGILEAQSEINELQLELNDLHYDMRIGVEVDPSRVDELNAKLDEAKQKKDELTQSSEDNILANIDLDEQLKQAQATLEGWTSKLQSGDFSNISKVEVEANISNAQSDIERIQQDKDKLQEPTLVEINAVTGNLESKIEELQAQANRYEDKEYCASFKMTDEAARAAISRLNDQIREVNEKRIKVEAYAKTNKANDELDTLDNRKLEDKNVTVKAETSEAHKNLCEVEDDIDRINAKNNPTITVTTIEKTLHEDEYPNSQSIGGNFHASGTAKAGGDLGNKHPGKTLVGELGREIVVNPYTGKWHTVGDDGAEFVNIPKGAIVFNHLQTEDLLSKGFVASRAMALASGNAFVSGNAKVSLKKGISLAKTLQPLERNAARNAAVVISNSPNSTVVNGTVNTENPENQNIQDENQSNTNSQPEISYDPNDPNAQYLLDSGASVNDEKEEKTALDIFKEWFSSLFDWLEIQMKNHSDRIDKYIKKAEDAKSGGRYNTAAKNYALAIDETSRQSFDQKKAVRKYAVQASTILDTAVAQGVITDGESSIIKRGVQTGDMDISQYCDEVQEVIKSYQTWYEKSKDAEKSLDDLHANIRTYINDLKELRVAQRDASLDKIETSSSIGGSGFAFSYTTKNSLLNYSNAQLNKKNNAYDKYVKNVDKDVSNVIPKYSILNRSIDNRTKYHRALNRAKQAISSRKAVSNKDLSIIKSKNIYVYNQLFAYNEAVENLKDARLEQAVNYAANSAEKFSNISQKYDNKEQTLNDKISLYKTKSSNAISSKSKNNLLDKASNSYDSIVANSKNKLAKFTSQVDSISRGMSRTTVYEGYDKANKLVSKAQSYVYKRTTIPPSVLTQLANYIGNGVETWFYQSCIDYNNAIEYEKEAKEQYEIAKQMAIQEKAAIGVERFNNVKQEYTNILNTNQAAKNKESIRQSIKTTRGLDLTASDYHTLKGYNSKDKSLYTSEVSALQKTIQENVSSGKWKKGSQEYIDAQLELEELRAKILECVEEEERLNNEIAALPYSIFERAISLIQTMRSNIQSALAIKVTRGISKTDDDINREIRSINDELDEQIRRREKLKEDYNVALNAPDGVYGGKKAEEWLKEYYEADTEINKLRENVESLNNEIAQLPYDAYEKALSLLDSIASYNKSISDLTKAQGKDLSENDYLKQISDNNNILNEYEKERVQTYKDYLKALSDLDGVYGGKTSDEWLTKYNELGITINGLKADNEDIIDAMRDDVYWRNFERSHKAAQALKDVLSGISDLIDDDMIYDKNGNFTDYGVAQMANIVKQFETARKEVQNYTDDIQNLNSLYERGYYNQDEFNEKLNELHNGLFDSASAMKSYISEIINMNKKLAESELDALFKLIDARNDALTAKKNYYDYNKTIKDKTKDIQSLQAQIGALEGIETAEAKAQKARLEADMSDKKDDLNDTIMNHSFELSKDALDELKTILQDEFDERWDNIGQDLSEIQKLIVAANELTAAQSHIVGNALNKLLSFYGINPSSTDLNRFGDVTGYASGTRKVDRDKVAWTQEDGREVIIRKSDGAILTPLSRGDGVIPNNLTDNLFDWGMHNPQEFADSLVRKLPDIPKVKSPVTTVKQYYDSLLNVEGNVDSTVVTDLEKFAKTFYQGAYKYTINEIARDARKKGIKP